MKSSLLLPHRYKLLGWIILIPATIAGIFLTVNGFSGEWLTMHTFAMWHDEVFAKSGSFDWILIDLTNTLAGSSWLIGAMLVGFSREKREDEFIANLRLSSLMWSVWVNYILLLFGFFFVYGSVFLNVMIYNMFTILIIFIARFNFLLYRHSTMPAHEK